MHATVRIGTATVELSDPMGPYQPMPSSMMLAAEDADATYQRALNAGCTSISVPAEQPWGVRMGSVLDPFGNQWHISGPPKKS